MFTWLAAVTLGLMGSFHCVGMCGPIALVLPLKEKSWPLKVLNGLAYNLGRTVTYGFMGFVFGLAGAGLTLAGFQSQLSIAAGTIMILMVVLPWIFGGSFSAENLGQPVFDRIRKPLTYLMKSGSTGSLFLIGLLNGWLPCGLVYTALAGALGSGNVLGGVIYMVLFGLATIPMMLLVSLAGNLMSLPLRSRFNRIIPYIVILVGALFILRGLNLGIPYLSPREEKLHIRTQKTEKAKHKCCSAYYFFPLHEEISLSASNS